MNLATGDQREAHGSKAGREDGGGHLEAVMSATAIVAGNMTMICCAGVQQEPPQRRRSSGK